MGTATRGRACPGPGAAVDGPAGNEAGQRETTIGTRLITPRNVLSLLAGHPLAQRCLTPYLEWLETKVPPPWDEYDVMALVREGGLTRLGWLEDRLSRSIAVLGIQADEFLRAFCFEDDLLTKDPEKVHDVLAEPLLVLDLERNGFSGITKLPLNIPVQGVPIALADFTAVRGCRKFAIEPKTIRIEKDLEEGKFSGKNVVPGWWREEFLSKARRKIDSKRRRVLTQLENTCAHFSCEHRLLVLYDRRLGTSTLMGPEDYREDLRTVRQEYHRLDYLACKNYFAGPVVFEPSLPGLVTP